MNNEHIGLRFGKNHFARVVSVSVTSRFRDNGGGWEDVLWALWRSGLDPSVHAVVEGADLSLPRFLFLLQQP